jgi:hypothetical protein
MIVPASRLLRLHLLSRRTIRTAVVLAGIAAVLRVIQPWTEAPGAIARGAAVVVGRRCGRDCRHRHP